MNILFAIALTTGILSGIWGVGCGRSRPAELGRIPRLYGLFRLPAGRLERAGHLVLHGDERRGLGVSDYPR